MLHVEISGLDQIQHDVVELSRLSVDRIAVDAQEDIYHGKCNSLVAVDEGVILHEAFKERGRLVNDGVVIARPRPMKGGFKRTGVAYAGGSAVAINQLLVEKQRIGGGDVFGHLASA